MVSAGNIDDKLVDAIASAVVAKLSKSLSDVVASQRIASKLNVASPLINRKETTIASLIASRVATRVSSGIAAKLFNDRDTDKLASTIASVLGAKLLGVNASLLASRVVSAVVGEQQILASRALKLREV